MLSLGVPSLCIPLPTAHLALRFLAATVVRSHPAPNSRRRPTGAGRFRLRRLEKVNAEALLITSCQNVKRLLAFGTRHPRREAQAAALQASMRPLSHALRAARRHFAVVEVPLSNVLQQPDKLRRGLRQDQGGIGGGDRGGALGDQRPRRSGLLRACRIPPGGSPTVKRAVRKSLLCTRVHKAAVRRP